MFLDLKGSTQIAEKLGELTYFRFLQEVIKEITPILISTKAEVYQYVGDEIVLSWDVRNGIRDMNCIRCYQRIKRQLKDTAQKYQMTFDAIPYFKAGLHVGKATVGEIGVLKRDIVYSGDVLNTTARIQSKCNDLGADLLLSGDLVRRLQGDTEWLRSIGKVALRGKSEEIELYAPVAG